MFSCHHGNLCSNVFPWFPGEDGVKPDQEPFAVADELSGDYSGQMALYEVNIG